MQIHRHQFMGNQVLKIFAPKDDEVRITAKAYISYMSMAMLFTCFSLLLPLPEKHAGIALSALIQALDQLNMAAIVRYAYSKSSNPQVGAAFPCIKQDYEVRLQTSGQPTLNSHGHYSKLTPNFYSLQCLIYIQLPFMEDLREFTFPSLENKKFIPSGSFFFFFSVSFAS